MSAVRRVGAHARGTWHTNNHLSTIYAVARFDPRAALPEPPGPADRSCTFVRMNALLAIAGAVPNTHPICSAHSMQLVSTY